MTRDAAAISLKDQLVALDDRFWIVNAMEMFERLAYYGVRSVIAIYMVLPRELGGPELSHVDKGMIFAWWAGMQSVLPMFTGGFADRYGHKRTIAAAIVLKIIGYVLMAIRLDFWGFFAGCMLLAAGTAIFKPGVQGTLAATLDRRNASVGWAIFYQLVNVGGFLGPVLAGVLRLMDWQYVFYACAGIVAINFLWLPFYDDPTHGEEANEDPGAAWGALSRALTPRLAQIWTALWWLAALVSGGLWLGGVLGGWGLPLACGFFAACFTVYSAQKASFDAGRVDPFAVLVVSVAGLFQHRVLFFCLVFSGFWLMFNQVFDLLPNVIDDWVDSSDVMHTVGLVMSASVGALGLAGLLSAVIGGVCAAIVLLALRPDRRPITEVGGPAYGVVAMALLLAWIFPAQLLGVAAAAPALAVVLAAGALYTRISARLVAGGTALVGAIGSFLWLRGEVSAGAADVVAMAEAGGQVNPEWMINLNPGLIVFTMVFFGWLTSFVRPLTAIIAGMAVATAGSLLAGTATFGWICIAGIGIFSVGEMLSSPKKMEYLATLAPKGSEGLFMGYANIPVAIGWIAGSIFAGSRYEQHGDKVNLARRHLVDVVGRPASEVEALSKTEVLPTLADHLGLQLPEVQRLLFATYRPDAIWLDIAIMGAVSIAGMVIYDRVLARIDARR